MPHSSSLTLAVRRLALALPVLVAGLASTPVAHAQVQWYRIEVVLYDQPGSAAVGEEHWPAEPGEPDLGGAVELVGADGLPADEDTGLRAYRLLGRASYRLGGVWARLQRSGEFRPLAHFAWNQPGLGPGTARPAHVVAWANGLDGAGAVPIIDGTLRVYRTRFLHAEVDLLYRPRGSGPIIGAARSALEIGDDARVYRLTLSRKMRSRELHYVEHPLFGLFIQVLPLDENGVIDDDAQARVQEGLGVAGLGIALDGTTGLRRHAATP